MAPRAEACWGDHPGQRARPVVTLRPGFAEALVLQPFQRGDSAFCPGFCLPRVIPLLSQHWHLKHFPCSTGWGGSGMGLGGPYMAGGSPGRLPGAQAVCLGAGVEEGEGWHRGQLQPQFTLGSRQLCAC